MVTGQDLGSYRILEKLGEGGMGQVYRARDRKLNRDVALKVLPDSVATDPDRVARFTREAHALAALNHANVAQIYDAGTIDATTYLVMEFVAGDDLSVQIARGPIPLAEAVPIARQIADALEAAHERGIVHRDLKPANIKVRPDGTVKVLDFGLAKALAPAGADDPVSGPSNSPTLTARATGLGMILGTAAYMAPEQARGKHVDRRADIFAFGVVLYEMLTGRRAFEGDEVSDVLAAVLRAEPSLDALPVGTPVSVRRLLRRCLEKDPRKRLSAIGDARLELDEHEAPPAAPAPQPRARRSVASMIWPAIAGIVLTAGIARWLWPSAATPDADVTRVSLLAAPGVELYPDSTQVAISPNGRLVAFVVGRAASPETQLWVRELGSLTARRIEEGDGASLPFWSPSSQRIGFFSKRKLKVASQAGGRAEVLADAPGPRGGAWSTSDVIVFAPDAGGPLHRVSANGGDEKPVTSLDASRKESGHRFPVFLPDGEHFLFAALPGHEGKFNIFVGALGGGAPALVGAMESSPVYAEPGWLVFLRRGAIVAQPFDASTRELKGEAVSLGDQPTSVLDPVQSFTAGHAVSASTVGSLAYYSAPSQNTTATWLDAAGKPTSTLNVPLGQYSDARISPDGRQGVFVKSISPSESSLWLVDLTRGGALPLSSGLGRNDSPVWSTDGKRIVFAADRDGPQNLFIKNIGDASPEQPVYQSDILFKNPTGWSPDDNWIVYTQLDAETAHNVWMTPSAGNAKPSPLVTGRARDDGGPVSPDGKWLAYLSDDSGKTELYVQSFPQVGNKAQVSAEGALVCWWTRDSRSLVYTTRDLGSLWRADIEPGVPLRVSTPKRIATLPANLSAIDAMPDRQSFLALVRDRGGVGSLTVVDHWPAALAKVK